MDIFKAIDSLNRGKKIRDVKSPPGAFLEKRDGKIISSNGYEGITLNTDAEYEIYEEKESEFINKISILLEDLRQYTQKTCLYDCKKCELFVDNKCIKRSLKDIIKRKDTEDYEKDMVAELKEIKDNYKKYDIPNYNNQTFISIPKISTPGVLDTDELIRVVKENLIKNIQR